MRGADTFTESLFTMRRLEDFVPENHPLRPVRQMVNLALKNIEPLLSGMYAADIKGGRPSIAPEKLLRAMLLQIFYGICTMYSPDCQRTRPAGSRNCCPTAGLACALAEFKRN